MSAPGLLALRAINQYRRRDVLAYLGLRYYLANVATRSDRWAQEVATDLVLRRSGPSYLSVQHFKEVDSRGQVQHRNIYLPGPNEALAEAALLDACAKRGGAFARSERVFSYRLASERDSSGVFQHYMHGLRERHSAIASACKQQPSAKVVYLDIRRFYPSVTVPRAKAAWLRASESAGLEKHWIELGIRLLDDHASSCDDVDGHLLTGPMFSHLLGNLVLQPVDDVMASEPARYFRYVDDIILVGNQSELDRSISVLKVQLDDLDLVTHGEESSKSLTVPAEVWLHGEHDFVETKRGPSWMTLVGDLKRLLVLRPDLRPSLRDSFASIGVRLPVPDYAAASEETSYRARLEELFRTSWFRKIVRTPSVLDLVDQAKVLQGQYLEEALRLLESIHSADAFHVKRLVPKLRFRFGRLAYLGESSRLVELAAAAREVPALRFQSEVVKSIATGDLTEVVKFGVNAAQASAQPLHMERNSAAISADIQATAIEQSIAVLKMNGLDLEVPESISADSEIVAFASKGASSRMMRSGNPFIREIACLHGITDRPRHSEILSSAFDRSEEIALDAIEQEHQSS